jgi:tetratricopeptide (TPR) repeat protein
MANRRAALVLTIALTCACASADTIWLKNGVSIKANKAVTKGDQVEYIVGTTTYFIPASQVERIEKTESFGVAVSTVGPNANIQYPAALATRSDDSGRQTPRVAPPRAGGVTVVNGDALLKKILIYDHIDDRALGTIESEGDANTSAAAYTAAANYEYSTNKDLGSARRYLKRALDFAPENVALLCWYSSLLIEEGEYAESTSRAEFAVKVAPESADAQYALGTAYYVTNRLPEAIAAWKHCLQIRPNESLKQYVTKVERELAVEENFQEQGSSHFALRFQGQRTRFTMAGEILRVLEQQYSELSRELGFTPQSTITVILYTEQEFFDVTQSPSWAVGLNDGKIRIPVKNVSTITTQFEHTLRHEMSHSFVHFMTRGKCPGWIDEGIAQAMEPREPGNYRYFLAKLFSEKKYVPLRRLETSFFTFSGPQATVAYAESLVAIDYIRSVYGMRAVQQMLERLAAGESGEDAVKGAIGMDYTQLEKHIGDSLNSTAQGQ